jgi:hypothetical protein
LEFYSDGGHLLRGKRLVLLCHIPNSKFSKKFDKIGSCQLAIVGLSIPELSLHLPFWKGAKPIGSNRLLRAQTLTVSFKNPFDSLAGTTTLVRSTNDDEVSAQCAGCLSGITTFAGRTTHTD